MQGRAPLWAWPRCGWSPGQRRALLTEATRWRVACRSSWTGEETMTTETPIPGCVGVLGGGRMGAGITHGFVLAGATVVVVERDGPSAEAARERVEASLATSLERSMLDGNLDELTGRLSFSTNYRSFAGCDLVVEALPEDMELKVAALTRSEEHTS